MKTYRTIDDVLADRRKATKLSEAFETLLYSPHVIEQLDNPFDIFQSFQQDDYLDMSTIAWANLPIESQILFAKNYQAWFSWHSGHARSSGFFPIAKNVELKMRFIPPAKFIYQGDGASAIKKVFIDKPFWMGKYEVTQKQWEAVMGDNPSHFRGDSDLPVEQVNFTECQIFCEKTGFRLPTEAQWEMACRAGTVGDFNFNFKNISDFERYVWCRNNANTTHPVGEKKANAFGLHDMLGNVGEWCADHINGYHAVHRGGGWAYWIERCRSNSRDLYRLDGHDFSVGFRVVKSDF